MSVKSAVDKSSLLRRYMVVEYAANVRGKGIQFDENGGFKNHMPLHHAIQEYHWSHLDQNHVILIGSFHPHYKKELDSRSDVSILPSTASSKAVSTSVKKSAHWAALKKNLGVSDTTTMVDVVELLAMKHGPLFASNH